MPDRVQQFYSCTQGAQKVVVIDLGFLGETVALVPALWELRRHYEQASLHLVTTPIGCELARMANCVDRCWPVEVPTANGAPAAHRVIRALRRERFDAALNLSGDPRSVALLAHSKARHCLAPEAARRGLRNRLKIKFWAPTPAPELPLMEQRRQVLAAAGFALETPRYELRVAEEDQAWAAAQVPEEALHFALGTNHPLKEWPPEHYATLTELLLEEIPPPRIVLSGSGSAREQGLLDVYFTRVGSERVRRLREVTVGRLAAALQRCRLHVGPASGVVLLAAALGVPTVSFHRKRGPYQAWLPPGEGHHAFLVSCPCGEGAASRCVEVGRALCLSDLTPKHVFQLIRQRYWPPR